MTLKKRIKAAAACIAAAFMLTACSQGSSSSTNSVIDNNQNTLSSIAHNDNRTEQESSSPNQTLPQAAPETDTAQPAAVATRLNGKDVSCNYAYTYNAEFGHYFAASVETDFGGFLISPVLPDGVCKPGVKLSLSDFKDNVYLYLMVVDGNSYYEYVSSETDMFSSASFSLNRFSSMSSAEWTLECAFNYNGNSYNFSCSGSASYTEAENNSSGSGSGQDNGICTYCSGSGRCHVCNGMGYTTWGGTRVDCSACNGLGYCYYCEGTGIQKYIVRGVPIS